MKYRKKPVEIEAFKFYVDYMPDWFMGKVSSGDITLHKYDIDKMCCEIQTLEGVMTADSGDYIVKGVQGEIYSVKPDIFHETYERVEAD